MYSLLVLSKIFNVFPQKISRAFTLCILFEHSIHKFKRNLVFISSVQKYPGKISFYPFPKNNRIVIFFKKTVKRS